MCITTACQSVHKNYYFSASNTDMKLSAFAILLPHLLISPAAAQACSGVIELGGSCNLDAVNNAIAGTSCTLAELFPGEDAATAVAELCKYDAPVQFVEIQGTYQRDHNYMDGGGSVTDGEHSFEMNTARLNRFITNSMNNKVISWPEYEQKEEYNAANGFGENGYMTNFNIDRDAEKGSCKMNTVMCCFTESAKETLNDNSDICRHDLSTSPQSNHVDSGWSIFTNDEPAHCVGFTWKENEDSDTHKGNALFHASLYQTATKGYMSNVPGAPMCACVEQMPVVTEAACITATGTGLTYQLIIDADTGNVSATNSVSMTYGDCGDLSTHVKTVHAGTAIETAIDDYLVGANNCDDSNAEYLNNEQLLIPSATNAFKNLDGVQEEGITWKQLFGEGIYFLPPHLDPAKADEEMRSLMGACLPKLGRYCLLLRKCPSCTSIAHKEIVYQRIEAFPSYQEGISTAETVDLPNLFMNQWRQDNNVMHVHYELYSSVQDALSKTNPWQVADYNTNDNNFGFPRNSGPATYTYDQWNSYKWGGGSADQHGFYVEIPSETTSA